MWKTFWKIQTAGPKNCKKDDLLKFFLIKIANGCISLCIKVTWTRLADHEMGVFWNFLEVKFRENSKPGGECKHRATRFCLKIQF